MLRRNSDSRFPATACHTNCRRDEANRDRGELGLEHACKRWAKNMQIAVDEIVARGAFSAGAKIKIASFYNRRSLKERAAAGRIQPENKDKQRLVQHPQSEKPSCTMIG